MMGIYIKGMEIQRDGTYRMGLVVKEGKITAGLVKEESFADKDIEWFDCSLIQNHGDLIDRDELIKRKGSAYDINGHELYAVGTGTILRMPAIIPADRSEE